MAFIKSVGVRFIRNWKIWLALVVAAGVVAGIMAVASGAIAIPPIPRPWETPAEVAQPIAPPAREEAADQDVVVNGKLVFPARLELTFDTPGEVGAVLVSQGDRVTRGQELARLESLSITLMEQTLAQALFDLDAAQKALDETLKEFQTAPLKLAELQANIVRVEKELADTEERLSDFHQDHEDLLEDARQRKVDLEVALARAQDNLRTFDQFFITDQDQQIDDARLAVTQAELALELVQQRLANFEIDFDERVGNAIARQVAAERAFDAARQALSDFLWNPIPDDDSDSDIDIDLLNRLKSTITEVSTDLRQAEEALSDLMDNRGLEEESLNTEVAAAQARVDRAKDVLTKLEDSEERALGLQERQAAVESARFALDRINEDIAELGEGPDQEELALLQEARKLSLEQLADLRDIPDAVEVELREALIVSAQARVDDAREELAGAYLRAPFDGIVALVNLEVGHRVSEESRVMELLEPSQVEIHGLVDAADVGLAQPGNPAVINLDSMPDVVLKGIVAEVAPEPRTERGVVSYPVVIEVSVPAGVEVPVRLSAVATTILN